jgi:hypothetical protein
MTLSCPGIALDATVRARILAYAYRGVDAATMGIGPVPAQGRPGLERRPTARSRVRRDRDVEDRSLLASTTCWRTSRRTPGGCLRPQLGRWPSRREALRALAGPRWRRRRVLRAGGGGLQLQGDRREARGDLHERQPARVRGAGRAEGAQARRLTWCGGGTATLRRRRETTGLGIEVARAALHGPAVADFSTSASRPASGRCPRAACCQAQTSSITSSLTRLIRSLPTFTPRDLRRGASMSGS